MRRRAIVLSTLAVSLDFSSTARAQALVERHHVGVLTPSIAQWEPEAFAAAMQALGYVEGKNLFIDVRSAERQLDRLPALATKLVQSRPSLIVAVNTPGVRAAIDSGTSLPIVMAFVGDPIATGFVTNLARPSGNVTGVSNSSRDLAGKRVSLLKQAVPDANRIAALMNPDDPVAAPSFESARMAANVLGVELRDFAVRGRADYEAVFDRASKWGAQAIYRVTGQGTTFGNETAVLAVRYRLPTMLLLRREVEAGGLMSYYPSHRVLAQRVAFQVDRILRGTDPRDIPVEQPTKFELVINRRTARAIGLELPGLLLARADEVIE